MANGLTLLLHQLANSPLSQGVHVVHFLFAERALFAGALQLNNLALVVHDKVEVHFSPAVFDIIEVDHRHIADNARTDSRDV